MAKKTTAAQRSAYIKQLKPVGYGAKAVYPRDMSFIDRLGNIIRPNKKDFDEAMAKRDRYFASRKSGYRSHAESRYENPEHSRRSYGIVALAGLLGSIFFLSPNLTGNAIGTLTNETSSVVAMGLLIVGVIASFLYFNKK